MSKPLSLLSYLFLLVVLSSIAAVALDIGRPFVLTGVITTGAIGSILMILWLRVLRRLTLESQRILHGSQKAIKVDGTGLTILESNHTAISKKFERSAELIASLADPEKLSSFNDLNADDAIDGAILSIHTELQRVKEEEQRRNWVTQGLAKFAEVLRTKEEIKQYGSHIISELVRHLDINQGGIYIEARNEAGDRCLDLLACYAYSKKRIAESRISLGAGLLGQCMLEHEVMFLTDIPRDYTTITSGLGESTPRNVVIVPLMFDTAFYGAIELVAFEPLQPHQVEFVREVSKSIAAEVASLQNVVHTEQLLAESNVLAERLQSRENELQHHLETISATQLEMSRKQAELSGTINAIDGTLATANFTMDGKLINANEIFLKILGYDERAVHGKSIHAFTGDDPSINLMWENLMLGKVFSGEFKMRDHAGKEMWLSGTFNPIIVEGDVPQRILMLAQFTTQEKEKLNELGGMVSALKATFPVIEFNADFRCKTANEKAMKLFGVSRIQLKSKGIADFLAPVGQQQWPMHQDEIFRSDSIQLSLPLALHDQIALFEVSFSVSRGLDGAINKIILILIRQTKDQISLVA
ncbi:MAG: PAS domain-containing protein [Chryseolinea sp.]